MSASGDDLLAWRQALELARAEAEPVEGARVPRVILSVELEGEGAGLVFLHLEEGRLVAVDERGERGSPLATHALAWLSGLSRLSLDDAKSPSNVRVSIPPRPSSPRTSLPPPEASRGGDDALRELALLTVRAGWHGADRGGHHAALGEPLGRLRSGASPRLARFLARFEGAIEDEDTPLLARLLLGALDPRTPTRRERVDLRLLEVAREHVDAASRRSLERRHLIDLDDGAFFVEERDVSAPPLSLGPMPRQVEVGFAEEAREPGRAALAIHQYTITPEIPAEVLARLRELASSDVPELHGAIDALLRANPGFAEPIVLFAPSRWIDGRPSDGEGHGILLGGRGAQAACARLGEVLADQEPTLLVLAASSRRGVRSFVPLTAILEGPDGSPVFVRLRG